MTIVYEGRHFWVARVAKGFEILKHGTTASTRVGFVGDGAGPQLGIERAIAQCKHRDREESTLRPLFVDGSAARTARSYGATHQRERLTPDGIFLGYDYFNAAGRMIMQSMRACGNPQ